MDTEATHTMVVGFDGSPEAERALEWALDEAHRRDMRMVLIHGVEITAAAASPYGSGIALEQLEAGGQQVLDEAVARVRAAGIPVEGRLEIGSAAHALIEASTDAELLVVGSRGHGGFAGLLLGSVSNACVHRAHCPVVVVPHGERHAA